MDIGGYFIGGYSIILVVASSYFIGAYFINGYWWLFY
jgi:hypothetical protein